MLTPRDYAIELKGRSGGAARVAFSDLFEQKLTFDTDAAHRRVMISVEQMKRGITKCGISEFISNNCIVVERFSFSFFGIKFYEFAFYEVRILVMLRSVHSPDFIELVDYSIDDNGGGGRSSSDWNLPPAFLTGIEGRTRL